MASTSLKLEWGRRHRGSALVALIGNLVPVAGVLFWGWSAAQILVLYWLENLVVGLFAFVRVASSRGGAARDAGDASKRAVQSAGLGCFFLVHFGIFCAVHGVFVASLASSFMERQGQGWGGGWAAESRGVWIGFLALAAVQAFDFVREWLIPRAWRTAEAGMEMAKPYGRIVVLHLTILIGAALLIATRAPVWVVLLLCALKTVIDLFPLRPAKVQPA